MTIFVKNLLHRLGQAKASSIATEGDPKWSKGCPRESKKNSKSFPGKEIEVERHPMESDKIQNCMHVNKIQANSRSTAIQLPASTSLS